jgi:hypothetical protein
MLFSPSIHSLPPWKKWKAKPKKYGSPSYRGKLQGRRCGVKRWYLIAAVPLGLVIVVYVVVRWNAPSNFVDIRSRDSHVTNTQSEVGTRPDGQGVPPEVLRLRHKQQLRPLTEQEDGTTIQDLPDGIYGFAMCKVGALRATRSNPFSLEIHKHAGIVYYVGYASDEDIDKYLTRHKNFHILTSPHASAGASSLFEIPIDFVSKCEERPDKDGDLFDLFVTTIPELHS